MKVYIKNKIWSVGGGSSVTDANQQPVFTVKGRAFSFTRVKHILDANGNKLFKVRNRFINLFVHKAYIYDANGHKIATVKDKFFNAFKQYTVHGYKDEIQTQGAFFGRTAQILKNGEPAGEIRRQITIVADAFELEASAEDIPFFVAFVIAVDNITDKKHD